MISAKSKWKFLLLSILFLSSFYNMSSAVSDSKKIDPQEKVKNGLNIMGYIFDAYPNNSYLIKYRQDGRFLGVLLLNDDKVGHVLEIYDVDTGQKVFNYSNQDKEVLNFKFKKNAVIVFYKSALWEEKMAYDLYSGRVVRRYSTWFGYNK